LLTNPFLAKTNVNSTLSTRKMHARHTLDCSHFFLVYAMPMAMHGKAQSDKSHVLITSPSTQPALSPQLGFVVQFRIRAGQPATYFAGRVEHMVSGRTAHFQSLDELTKCFVQMLSEPASSPSERRNED
jgi:hypothetical protein